MTKKQKRLLWRVVSAMLLYLPLLLSEKSGIGAALSRNGWTALYLLPYFLAGYDVLKRAVKNIRNGQVFDENFLMMIATVAAFFIGEYSEACAVMLFYQVGELFQSYAVGKSRASIAEMMQLVPEYANLEREDGSTERTEPDEVPEGSVIAILPGERIPLDGVVLTGESFLDTAALTGESVPKRVGPGAAVVSGCLNGGAVLRVRTTKRYEDSTVAKILELVESASERKAQFETFITRFARRYTPCVTVGAVLLALVPPLFLEQGFGEWIRRACIFLIVSCPCALVISVPLGFFGGIGAASRLGVLVKGSNFLETAAEMNTLVFDKTGTLTQGEFQVTAVYPSERGGLSARALLLLAAAAERGSTHPIAKSIVVAAECEKLPGALNGSGGEASEEPHRASGEAEIRELRECAGRGVTAFRAGKKLLIGSAGLMEEAQISCQPPKESGTVVYIAEDGVFLGSLVISDAVKEGAREAVAEIRAAGVRKCVMLTGDRKETATAVAEAVGIDEFYSGLLPADKVQKIEALLQEGGARKKVGFVGDGMNDAPVLMRADIGIAMGSLGSDAAIEAADIVLMDDDLRKIPRVIRIARKTLRIVRQNVAFALAVKAAVLLLGALGIANMWEAVFGDVGVTVLAVLNSMRALRTEQ